MTTTMGFLRRTSTERASDGIPSLLRESTILQHLRCKNSTKKLRIGRAFGEEIRSFHGMLLTLRS
jgi:hypothetical protein